MGMDEIVPLPNNKRCLLSRQEGGDWLTCENSYVILVVGAGLSSTEDRKGVGMASATMKLTEGWCFRSRYACVHAFRVIQGCIMPFFGKDVGTKRSWR